MKKTLTISLAALLVNFCIAQNKVALSVYQDAKLLLIGDSDHNYDAGTLDLLVRADLQSIQQKYGFISVAVEFEYAEIKNNYYRYSVNAGYTLNRLIIKKLQAGASVGYGIIGRNQKAFTGFNGNAFLKYPLTKNLKFCLLSQVVDRKDIKKIRYSGFLGLEINLN